MFDQLLNLVQLLSLFVLKPFLNISEYKRIHLTNVKLEILIVLVSDNDILFVQKSNFYSKLKKNNLVFLALIFCGIDDLFIVVGATKINARKKYLCSIFLKHKSYRSYLCRESACVHRNRLVPLNIPVQYRPSNDHIWEIRQGF